MRRVLLLLVLVGGCARLADWGTPLAPSAIFPHPAGWGHAAGHGAHFVEQGVASCVGCHDSGPGSEFCGACHSSYPHPEGWITGETHGEDTWGRRGDKQCMVCHGLQQGTAGAMGCTACHASYPHGEGWAEAGQHGAWWISRGGTSAPCAPCHGDDLPLPGDRRRIGRRPTPTSPCRTASPAHSARPAPPATRRTRARAQHPPRRTPDRS